MNFLLRIRHVFTVFSMDEEGEQNGQTNYERYIFLKSKVRGSDERRFTDRKGFIGYT